MTLELALTVFGVLFVGVCAWLGWTLRQLAIARRAVHRLAFELVEPRWFRWWLRNAAECTALDPGRAHLLRLAVAAQLAPSISVFEADLHSIAADPERALPERQAAKSFLTEREVAARTREAPWDAWTRETGKPMFAPDAQREAYACALQSWIALFTRRLDEQVPGQADEVPETTH